MIPTKGSKGLLTLFFSFSFGGQKWTKSIAQRTKRTNTRLAEEMR